MKSLRILIVDDHPANVKLLRAILEAEGHTVHSAKDGNEALEWLRGNLPVDAIISDILMPGMDGYRLCLELRRVPKFSGIPVLVYTSTYTSEADEKTALELGADKFLRKPAPAGALLAALNSVISQPRLSLTGSAHPEPEKLQHYSERLVSKLEEKNTALEQQTETLRATEQQLRALAAKLQAAREEERVRISREMHDGMGEHLTGIEMGLNCLRLALEEQDDRISAPLLERIEQISGLTKGAATRMRKLCMELRPSILDDLGIVPALQWQVKEFQERTQIRCEHALEDNISLPPEHRTALFRICQELLTNVARHAHASRVKVSLRRAEGSLRLEVKDNGKGISADRLSGTGSLGLLGMRERAALLGGEVQFAGRPGKGTVATVTLPLPAEESFS